MSLKKEYKKYLLLITFGVTLFIVLQNFKSVLDIIGFVLALFTPFVLGICIAFVLNVLVKFIESKLLKKVNEKFKRPISLILTFLIVFGFLTLLLFLIIPELKNAITIFIDNIPIYKESIIDFANKLNLSTETMNMVKDVVNNTLDDLGNLFKDNSGKLFELTLGVTTKIISGISNFILGLVFAIYMLIDKEKLLKQSNKFLSAFMPNNKKMKEIAKITKNIFENFIVGQIIEAFIIGILCFIGMLILGLPYASTISVLVGFTALIPVFGAFIGTIIGGILIFVIDPIGALIFIVFIIALQQVEGNLIYPKVVGTKVGLPAIWVMLAVILGGSLYGIIGMLIGVPVFTVLYTLLVQKVNEKTKNQ